VSAGIELTGAPVEARTHQSVPRMNCASDRAGHLDPGSGPTRDWRQSIACVNRSPSRAAARNDQRHQRAEPRARPPQHASAMRFTTRNHSDAKVATDSCRPLVCWVASAHRLTNVPGLTCAGRAKRDPRQVQAVVGQPRSRVAKSLLGSVTSKTTVGKAKNEWQPQLERGEGRGIEDIWSSRREPVLETAAQKPHNGLT